MPNDGIRIKIELNAEAATESRCGCARAMFYAGWTRSEVVGLAYVFRPMVCRLIDWFVHCWFLETFDCTIVPALQNQNKMNFLQRPEWARRREWNGASRRQAGSEYGTLRLNCPKESANAQNDVEQAGNAHGGIASQSAAEANGGCLAYPSASAGYREDCAENGASRQLEAPKVAWKRRLVPRIEFTALFTKGGELHSRRRRSMPICTDGQGR